MQPVTEETITDVQIHELRGSLPRGHYMKQCCDDALASTDHPKRKRNARRECARLFNETRLGGRAAS